MPYAGVYGGNYQGSDAYAGSLAMFVDETGWAGFLKLNQTWYGGGWLEGIRVGTNGWFRGFTAHGGVLTGAIAGTNVTGSHGGAGEAWSLAASLQAATGAQQSAVGYYSGQSYGGALVRGILGADGRLYGWFDSGGGDGFIATLGGQNSFAATSVNGLSVTGVLDTTSFRISGTWISYWQSTSFTMTRTHSVAGPVCSYTLGVARTNLGWGATSAGFLVSAGAQCSWSAAADVPWLHTTSTGMGDGEVSYSADTNPENAFRVGAISVAGQNFTVTQAPAHFTWHTAFGWLYDSGTGWDYHNGFGWLWFDSGGVWIWSTTLQGWLAVTDPTSRMLWSQQFGWLTPSTNNTYTAETSTLGEINFSQYSGAPIPDGWVKSWRFGHVWANGDAKWFYSAAYGWLEIRPEGIWSVSQGSYL